MFLHDISRLLWGRRGGYKSWEYALAYVSSVFDMRQNIGVTDIFTDIIIDDNKSSSSDVLSGYLYFKNLGEKPMKLHISSFPSGSVDFIAANSNKIEKSSYFVLDLFGTKSISFKSEKKDIFLRVKVGDIKSYFLTYSFNHLNSDILYQKF